MNTSKFGKADMFSENVTPEDAYQKNESEVSCAQIHGFSRQMMSDYRRSISIEEYFNAMKRSSRLLALCAEPCMGKSMFLKELAEYARSKEMIVYEISLTSLRDKEATEYISSRSSALCNAMHRQKENSSKRSGRLVIIDDFPPSDECNVTRQVKAIARLRTAGFLIAFSLSPEARQLLDELSGVFVLGKQELMTCMPGIDHSEQSILTHMRFTRGIPSLVYSLPISFCESTTDEIPIAYQTNLACVASFMLRNSLGEEELCLRLAMTLLGSGTFDDLQRICGAINLELLAKIEQDAPFFGVNVNARHFSCLHTSQYSVLQFNHQELAELIQSREALALKTLSLLIDREEFNKAALFASFMREEITWEIIVSHAVQFVDAGYVDLVDSALMATQNEIQIENSCKKSARRMVDVFSGAKKILDARECTHIVENLSSFNSYLRETSYMAFLKVVLQQPICAVQDCQNATIVEKRIELHKHVVNLMLQGNIKSALRLVLLEQREVKEHSLTSALLLLDTEFILALLGVHHHDLDDQTKSAIAFLRDSKVSLLRCSVSLISCMQYLFEQNASVNYLYETERLISESEIQGNKVLQVAALFIASLLSLKNRAFPKAQLQIRKALSISKDWDSLYVTQVGELIEDVITANLGVRPTEERFKKFIHPSVRAVAGIIYTALFKSVKIHTPLWVQSPDCVVPENMMWLIRSLLCNKSIFERCLKEELPQQWLSYLYANEQESIVNSAIGHMDQKIGHLRFLGASKNQDTGKQDAKNGIHISLLGKFSVLVNGQEVSSRKLAYRSAKALIIYLSLAHNHVSYRSQIAQQIWPEVSIDRWQERLYQSTRVIRREIKAYSKDCEPLEASRLEKTLGFNMRQVSIDIDIFSDLVKSLTSSNNDEDIVHIAKHIETLYRGDLYLPDDECFRFAEPIRIALKEQYLEAMVVASSAALRLDHQTLAVHFAELAYLVDDMREDVLMALIQSLRKCGRAQDAQRYYDIYVSKFVMNAHQMPSKQLRMIVGKERGKESTKSDGGEITEIGYYDAM